MGPFDGWLERNYRRPDHAALISSKDGWD